MKSERGGLGMPSTAGDDFFDRLAAAQSRLSPRMSQVAAYVAEHYLQVAFMSTREIAAAAGVSLATVVRFPRELGYPDFAALRTAIQDRVRFDLDGVSHFRALSTSDRSPTALLRRIIETDIESLQALARSFSEPQFVQFVQALIEAPRVMIFGFRFVRPLAEYFSYSLAKIRPNVEAITLGDSTVYDRLRISEPDSVIVVIGFARYPADLLAIARYAHELPRRVFAITDSPISPFLPLAEVALFVRASRLDFVGSLAAPAALVNCLVSEAAVRLGPQATARLQELEEAAQAGGTYVPLRRPMVPSSSALAWSEEDDAPPSTDDAADS